MFVDTLVKLLHMLAGFLLSNRVALVVVALLGLVISFLIVRRISRRKLLIAAATLLATLLMIGVASHLARAYRARPLQFDGDSVQLPRTQIVLTLDSPVEKGKNLIWCAAFQATWKKLQNDLAKEPVQLIGAETACALLNASPVPEVPDGALYTATGWEDKGILDTIRNDMAARFPGSAVPSFPGIEDGSFVAFGHLESRCKFAIPYFDSTSSVEFKDSNGAISKIRTFGIRPKDDFAYPRLREQVEVLFSKRGEHNGLEAFALNLCKDSVSSQVVFARTALAGSLKETLDRIENEIVVYQDSDENHGFGPNDVLLVPEIAYRIAHGFDELEKRAFVNATLAGQIMDVAQQDIEFRLDRSGAELLAEVKMYYLSGPSRFIGDGPFLVYLKKRGAALPYFVMWVDNDELLCKWPGK